MLTLSPEMRKRLSHAAHTPVAVAGVDVLEELAAEVAQLQEEQRAITMRALVQSVHAQAQVNPPLRRDQLNAADRSLLLRLWQRLAGFKRWRVEEPLLLLAPPVPNSLLWK